MVNNSRNLPEPIMTFKYHTEFVAAAKLEAYEERVAEVQRLVDQVINVDFTVCVLYSSKFYLLRSAPRTKQTHAGDTFGPLGKGGGEVAQEHDDNFKFGENKLNLST